MVDDVTESDLIAAVLDDIEREVGVELRQAGDVDAEQVAARLGITSRRALDVMKDLVRRGRYTAHQVRSLSGRPMRVWRKVE